MENILIIPDRNIKHISSLIQSDIKIIKSSKKHVWQNFHLTLVLKDNEA